MLRTLYRCTVRLHPSGFRDRFGEEMLSIFDQQSGTVSALRVLADGLLSLLRQWILRPNFPSELAAYPVPPAIPDGIPFFATLDAFRPRPSAVINGVVLSAVLFCMTCIAIRYSWIRVLHVQIAGVSLDPYAQIHPGASSGDFRGKSAPSTPDQSLATGEKSDLIAQRLQVDVLPVEPTAPSSETQSLRALKGSFPAVSPLSSSGTIDLPLELYTGDYLSKNPKMKISIRIREGQLAIYMTGQPRRLLRPVSQTRFKIDASSDGWVEFVPDGRGRIQALRLEQNRQMILAMRH